MIQVRRFDHRTEHDSVACREIANLCWHDKVGGDLVEENIDYDLEIEQTDYFVAYEDDVRNVVGFAGVMRSQINYAIAEYVWCNVCPSYQGRGVGQQLTFALIDAAKAMQCTQIILTTHLPTFYQRHGFKTLAILDLAYGRSHLMIKDLQ